MTIKDPPERLTITGSSSTPITLIIHRSHTMYCPDVSRRFPVRGNSRRHFFDFKIGQVRDSANEGSLLTGGSESATGSGEPNAEWVRASREPDDRGHEREEHDDGDP